MPGNILWLNGFFYGIQKQICLPLNRRQYRHHNGPLQNSPFTNSHERSKKYDILSDRLSWVSMRFGEDPLSNVLCCVE